MVKINDKKHITKKGVVRNNPVSAMSIPEFMRYDKLYHKRGLSASERAELEKLDVKFVKHINQYPVPPFKKN